MWAAKYVYTQQLDRNITQYISTLLINDMAI